MDGRHACAVLGVPAHATTDEIRQAFRDAAAGPLGGLLGVTEEELVSSDFVNDPRSAVVDIAGPATSSPRTWTFAAYIGRHGARNPCPRCGRKNHRAGDVCQPDSSCLMERTSSCVGQARGYCIRV